MNARQQRFAHASCCASNKNGRAGPLHQGFIHPNWISPDLTRRIILKYERMPSRRLGQERIALISGVLRLSELGGFAGDPARAAKAVRTVADWAAHRM